MMRGLFVHTLLCSSANAASGSPAPADFLSFIPLLAVLGIMYFFFVRTQQKKDKQHKELIDSLHRGDRVLMTGGLFGTISKVGTDPEMMLEIADGVRVKVLKAMVATVVAKSSGGKTEPASLSEDSAETPDETSAPSKGKTAAPKKAATRSSTTRKN